MKNRTPLSVLCDSCAEGCWASCCLEMQSRDKSGDSEEQKEEGTILVQWESLGLGIGCQLPAGRMVLSVITHASQQRVIKND